MLKLVHERYAKDADERSKYIEEFSEALEANENLRPLLGKVAPPMMGACMILLNLVSHVQCMQYVCLWSSCYRCMACKIMPARRTSDAHTRSSYQT